MSIVHCSELEKCTDGPTGEDNMNMFLKFQRFSRKSQLFHLPGNFLALVACLALPAWAEARQITAEVVALDQYWEWNRFGSFNPAGMMYSLRRDVVNKNAAGGPLLPGEVKLRDDKRPRPLVLRANVGDTLTVTFENLLAPQRENLHPEASIPVAEYPNIEPGFLKNDSPLTRNASMAVNNVTQLANPGIVGIAPGEVVTYQWKCEREGTFQIWDNASPSGGEGDGGSMALGLFGALNCEPENSIWFRSQISPDELVAATVKINDAPVMLSTGHPKIDYSAVDAHGAPILNILKDNEIISSDLNAIIVFDEIDDSYEVTTEGSFREFTVIFHDEIKAVQAFAALDDPSMAGVRDGFAINYGASGMGAMLLANRSGVGPASDCVECTYEEFFLESWANGDPALLEQYPSDPSNVHHSYLNDKVRYRNLHVGPKETHVFHLHAHQWLDQMDEDEATYIDSQTIAPLQAFDYEIGYGGSGNRNKTVGDSIFHCHLYPHFAQGMWELWRVHDVFEDGTRRLPDGLSGPGTDPLTGNTLSSGTPIPAVVPVPGMAMAPVPTYGENGFPGYPFYIAGNAGHRAPQPPLDFFEGKDGGLPRHVFKDGDVMTDRLIDVNPVASGLFSADIERADLVVLPADGTPQEKAAMAFHAMAGGHASKTPEGTDALFKVNGLPPKPGAPFSDPCDPLLITGLREYNVSAITLDLVVNSHGWHDPQARINVLDKDVPGYEGQTTSADPFFFRAKSGECIEFRHTNRTPKVLALDDFQVETPTDTIGQHIHLVKFDVTSSDGAGNGWNYEDGTLAKGAVAERLHAAQAEHGGSAVDIYGEPVELPSEPSGFQTTVQRWWADPLLNKKGKDRTMRTVFTHDHFSPSSIQHHGFYSGLVIEPAGSTWLRPDGSVMDDGVGTQAMIIDSYDKETHPDHREFMVMYQDFALLYDEQDRPVDPPHKPEAISVSHHDPYLINYKQELPSLRAFDFHADGTLIGPKPGEAGDMAYTFDSRVHGDPFTEIFRAFEGDPVQFRVLQGGQEVQHVWHVNGLKWKRQPSNPDSYYVGSQEIGISEHFEMDVPNLPSNSASRADYLYHLGTTGAMWNGAWGILRTYSNPFRQKDLAPLPSNPDGRARIANIADFYGNGCPKVAPVKSFDIEAWSAMDLLGPQGSTPVNDGQGNGEIVYNGREGITDPSGLLYILAEDRHLYMTGEKSVDPLVIRANAGDCIEVNLTNFLPIDPATKEPLPVPDMLGDARLPGVTSVLSDDFGPSSQVSIHPQLLSYDIRRGDGSNVGFNPIQTASPDATLIDPLAESKTVTYTWYAGVISHREKVSRRGKIETFADAKPEAFGIIPLRSFGDVIKQGSQGLIGALIIEEEGATWSADREGLLSLENGTEAWIKGPGKGLFKEFVVLYQDGMNLSWEDSEIPDCIICDDHYDTGEHGLNYRTEPHWARLDQKPATQLLDVAYPADWSLGEIETPLFTASAGDQVVFRVAHPDGRARQRTFNVLGHDYNDGGLSKFLSGGSSLLAPGRAVNAEIIGGAKEGTWLYRDGPAFIYAGGSWGRFEVTP